MLQDMALNQLLLTFIESGDIKEAIWLVKTQGIDNLYQFGWNWFHTYFSLSGSPNYWLDFFQQLLLLDEVNNKAKKYFIGVAVREAIQSNSPMLILALPELSRVSELAHLTEICEVITNDIRISSDLFLINLLTKIESPILRAATYNRFVKIAYSQYNGFLLQEFQKLDNQEEFNFKRSIAKLYLNKEEKELLTLLLSFDKERAFYINQKMKSFAHGFGKIDYEGGLLAIAQRKQRKKKYEYNPTLLNIYEEDNLRSFEDYLTLLINAPLPVTERFIFAASHWICGEITITEAGLAKIFIVDSLGTTHPLALEALEIFLNLFPKGQAFLTQEQRQKAAQGCSVYALDDMAHLFKLHLEAKYQRNIWDYLIDVSRGAKIQIVSIGSKEIGIPLCPLPLSLMRTMQSPNLFQEIKARTREEQESPINNKQETAAFSAAKFFKHNQVGKPLNVRLDYKLAKLKQYVFYFLMANDPETVEQLMQEASFEAFKEKLELHPKDSAMLLC